MYGSYMAPWSTLDESWSQTIYTLTPARATEKPKWLVCLKTFAQATEQIDVIDVCSLHYSSIHRYFISYILFFLYKQIMRSHNQRFNRPGHLNVREAQRVAAAWVTLVISFFMALWSHANWSIFQLKRWTPSLFLWNLRKRQSIPHSLAHNFLQKRNMNYRTGWFTN